MIQNTTDTLTSIMPVMGTDLDLSREMVKPRILIIDDDPDYVSMMKMILRQADFDVSGVIDHQAALEKCMELKPDVILLDLMMPGLDGYDVFQRLRNVTNAPVVFISAAPGPDSLLKAFDLGAEDYISKPFNNSEIIARLRKILRHTRVELPLNIFYFHEIGLRIDRDAREVTLHGQPVSLTPREFLLLSILAAHAPRNVNYEKITRQLWGEDTRSARAHLKTVAFGLRKKLEVNPAKPKMLVNNRSIGYQLLAQP